MITNSEVIELIGAPTLQNLNVKNNVDDEVISLEADYWIPLFGLTPKLGPIANWGLNLDKNAINVVIRIVPIIS